MITIFPYKDRWPDEFRMIATRIQNAVGDRMLAIHHIGSTSVPQLAAKDVIDIQVTVFDLTASMQKQLEEIGFALSPHQQDHCPPGMQLPADELAKRHYRGTDRPCNLHIRKVGTFNQRYPILFRDYLRLHPMARDAYGEIKMQLAKYFPDNPDAYYDIKDPVCDALMAGAFEWAKTNQWNPGPSDR